MKWDIKLLYLQEIFIYIDTSCCTVSHEKAGSQLVKKSEICMRKP